MKLNKNLGTQLSKSEMKKVIGGGGPVCNQGDYARCYCSDNSTEYVLADGVSDAEALCSSASCIQHGFISTGYDYQCYNF